MLPGEVEIGKRTLANIRPPWIIKMGLTERARLSTWRGGAIAWNPSNYSPKCSPRSWVPFYIKVAQAHDTWCPSGDMDNSQTPGRRPERCPKAVPGLHEARRHVGNVPAQVARDPRTWEDLLC